MSEHIELNPATHITVGTVGEPGNRTFYLQGSQGRTVLSLIIEKTQAAMLSEGMDSLLTDLAKDKPDLIPTYDPATVAIDLRFQSPESYLFRVGNLGLGFNEDTNRIIIAAYELVEEGVDPNLVSFWGSIKQIQALIPHIKSTVKAGRPICGNCGQPMDKDGHFCPRKNGYRK